MKDATDIVDEINTKLRAASAVAHLLSVEPSLDNPISAAAAHVHNLVDEASELVQRLHRIAVKQEPPPKPGIVAPIRGAE